MRGRCRMVDGSAVCDCAKGSARGAAHVCVQLTQRKGCHGPRCEGVVGCTAPEHCAAGQVCERLTGRCRPLEEVDASRIAQPTGSVSRGSFCYVRDPTQARGCNELGEEDRCADGLHCVPTGPLGHNLVCGYPERLPGICRPTCSFDAPFCELGEGCMLVEGSGPVCLPLGFVQDECGEALCVPGQSCVLGGTLRGVAHGQCKVPCEGDDICPDGTGTCQPENPSFPRATFCG